MDQNGFAAEYDDVETAEVETTETSGAETTIVSDRPTPPREKMYQEMYDDDDEGDSSAALEEKAEEKPDADDSADDGKKDQPPPKIDEGQSFSVDELVEFGNAAGIDSQTVRAYANAHGVTAAAQEIHRKLSEPPRMGQAQAQGQEDSEGSFQFGIDLPLQSDDNDEGYDPQLISAINGSLEKMWNDLHGRSTGLEGNLQKIVQTVQSATAVQKEMEFDKMVEKLGDGYARKLGKGRSIELQKSSPEFKLRQKIFKNVQRMSEDNPDMSSDAVFEAAVRAFIPDGPAVEARHDIRQKIEKRNRQAIGSPSGKNGHANVSPEKRALANLTSRMREMGLR